MTLFTSLLCYFVSLNDRPTEITALFLKIGRKGHYVWSCCHGGDPLPLKRLLTTMLSPGFSNMDITEELDF